jgi:hypothetical protein
VGALIGFVLAAAWTALIAYCMQYASV